MRLSTPPPKLEQAVTIHSGPGLDSLCYRLLTPGTDYQLFFMAIKIRLKAPWVSFSWESVLPSIQKALDLIPRTTQMDSVDTYL